MRSTARRRSKTTQPGNGDCRLTVGAALAVAFGDCRRIEWRIEPSSWHEPLRTSATAGKAPNACVQRGRERHSATDGYRTHGLRCNALLGDASNHQPCLTVIPSALVRSDGDHFTFPADLAIRTLWPLHPAPLRRP